MQHNPCLQGPQSLSLQHVSPANAGLQSKLQPRTASQVQLLVSEVHRICRYPRGPLHGSRTSGGLGIAVLTRPRVVPGAGAEGGGGGEHFRGQPGPVCAAGVAVYSRRAGPLAAWTNSLELAAVSADTDRAFLILDTGVNQRWRYGAYRRTVETTAEAQAWEQAKQDVGGLHFLAIQEGEEAEGCAGLWLLLDRKPPTV